MKMFISFLLGCIASGIVSLIWYKFFVPKITFAKDICKYNYMNKNEPYTYKIKFRNIGKRDIFELYLYCTLFIPDLQLKGSMHTVNINLSYNFKPLFKKRVEGDYLNPDALVRICINDEQMTKEFNRPIYSVDIRNKSINKQLILEDLLNIKPSSYIKFYIIAHDKFSGSKKIFESPAYTNENIKHGFYKYGELYVV